MAGANNAQMKAAGWKAKDVTKARATLEKVSHAAMRAAGFAPKRFSHQAKEAGSLKKAAAAEVAARMLAKRGNVDKLRGMSGSKTSKDVGTRAMIPAPRGFAASDEHRKAFANAGMTLEVRGGDPVRRQKRGEGPAPRTRVVLDVQRRDGKPMTAADRRVAKEIVSRTSGSMDAALAKIRAGNTSGIPMGTLKALRDRGLIDLSVSRGRRTNRGQEVTVEARAK